MLSSTNGACDDSGVRQGEESQSCLLSEGAERDLEAHHRIREEMHRVFDELYALSFGEFPHPDRKKQVQDHDHQDITPKHQQEAEEKEGRWIPSSTLPPPLVHDEVKLLDQLAHSGEARVFRALFKDRMLVAAKVFHAHVVDKSYMSELEVLIKLRHENVIKLIMAYQHPSPCIIMELMPRGDLASYLRKHGSLSVEETVRMSVGIAKGLEYLHANKVIHRDLKSHNILLKDNMEPVLADFGLSHISQHTLTMQSHNIKGTAAWLAPEMMRMTISREYRDGGNSSEDSSSDLDEEAEEAHQHNEIKEENAPRTRHYSNKVDIYAMSIIMWEMCSGQVPYNGFSIPMLFSHVVKDKRLPVKEDWDPEVVSIMKKCWSSDPDERPSASEVAQQLLEYDLRTAARADEERKRAEEAAVAAEAEEVYQQALALHDSVDEGNSAVLQAYVDLLNIAATLGHAQAQVDLGSLHKQGRPGVIEQSDEQAVELFRMAACQSHAAAQYNLGLMYAEGRGVEASDEQAAAWYHKAAIKGYADAQYSLSVMYEHGRGVPQNKDRAYRWRLRASRSPGDRASAEAALMKWSDTVFIPGLGLYGQHHATLGQGQISSMLSSQNRTNEWMDLLSLK